VNSNAATVYRGPKVQEFLKSSKEKKSSDATQEAFQELLGMASSEEARSVGLKRYTEDEIRNMGAIPQFSENRGISFGILRANGFRGRRLNVPIEDEAGFRELGEVIALIPEAFARPTSHNDPDASKSIAFGKLSGLVNRLSEKPGHIKNLLMHYFPEGQHEEVLLDILTLVKALDTQVTPEMLSHPELVVF
jgi:hypothetical protein